MLSSRTHHSVLRSVNIAPVVLSSLATASRIPVSASVAMPSVATASRKPVNHAPVATTSTATASRIPVHQRASVASVPTATVQHAPASSLPPVAVSRSKLVLDRIQARRQRVIANLDAAKSPASSLPPVAVSRSKLVLDRIQARRQQVIANPDAAKKRPTAPTSTRQSPSMSSRAPPPVISAPVSIRQPSSMPSRAPPPAAPVAAPPVSILKSAMKPSRTIPRPANACTSTVVSAWMPSPLPSPDRKKPRRLRGTVPYCEGRPSKVAEEGFYFPKLYQPDHHFGLRCACHGEANPNAYRIDPSQWETTPAEEDVVPSRPRVVRFANNPVSSTKRFRMWYLTVWPHPAKSRDRATEEDDNAAIAAIDECF